jgi:hypothetical protein
MLCLGESSYFRYNHPGEDKVDQDDSETCNGQQEMQQEKNNYNSIRVSSNTVNTNPNENAHKNAERRQQASGRLKFASTTCVDETTRTVTTATTAAAGAAATSTSNSITGSSFRINRLFDKYEPSTNDTVSSFFSDNSKEKVEERRKSNVSTFNF